MVKKKKRLAVLGLTVAMAGLLCVPFLQKTPKHTVEAATVTVQEGVLRDVYSYNTLFTVPEVIIQTPEGDVACSNAKVIFPNGTCYTDRMMYLSQCGEYTIIYDTGKYQVSKTFNVYKQNYTVSSSSSSVEYVEVFDFERYGTYYEKGNASVAAGQKPLRVNNGKGGLSVDLAAGDIFTYNVPVNIYQSENVFDVIKCYPEIIDLDLTTEDTETIVNSKTVKSAFVVVRLTDCYDANKYIEFLWGTNPTDGSAIYASVGTNVQIPVGLEWNQYSDYTNVFEYEGAYYKYHETDVNKDSAASKQYGTVCGNPSAATSGNLMQHGGMNFQYDVKTQKVYSSYTTVQLDKNDKTTVLEERVAYQRLVTDLDDAALYTERGKNIFDGFTTGECYLSLQTYQNSSSSVHIDIESIYGMEGVALQEYSYVDTQAPDIRFVGGKTYEKPLFVQKGVAVALPKAEVFEINGNGLYTTSVYANYGTEYETFVSSKNGMFMPTENTSYVAVYRSEDNYGNVTEKKIQFIVSSEKAIMYDENQLNTLQAGVANEIPDIQATGLNGEVTVLVKVTDPMGVETILEGDTVTYVPTVLGEYTICYEMTDGITINSYTYTVNCPVSDSVVFDKPFITNKYFIKGASYTIEDYFIDTVTENGLQPQLCTAYVSLDGGEFVPLTEEQRKSYLITASNTVAFKMEYNGQFGEVTTASVVDANYNTSEDVTADYTKYFLTDATVTAQRNYEIITDGSKETETIAFINPLSFSKFRFEFTIPTKTDTLTGQDLPLGNFERLEIKLIDYYDSSITASCIYEQTIKGIDYTVGKNTVSFNGGTMKALNETLYIDSQNNMLQNGNRGGFVIPTFTSDFCYLEITMSKITGESGIAIKSINEQRFNTRTSPDDCIFVSQNISGQVAKDTQYTVNEILVSNVLYPVADSAVTIQMNSPSGKSVTATNGVLLSGATNAKYTVTLDEIGVYRLTYNVSLPNGKVQTIPYVITVVDVIAPTIEFAEGYNEKTLVTLQKGVTYTAQTFTVTDDYSGPEAITTTIMYTTDEDNIVGLGETEFVFQDVGMYKVVIVALDAEGNMAMRYYNVKVV